MRYSHEAEVFNASDLVVVGAQRLVDIVRVGGVAGETLLLRAGLSLVDELLAHTDVLLHHLNRVDVVDLDVMSRQAVVQEVGREHHAVACVPELGLILSVEVHYVAGADEAEAREDHVGGDEPNKHA